MKLISFKLCPFVQQVVIALSCKHIQFEIEYVDLAAPPEWFLTLSPLKKVPILLIEKHILFDSIVINEFIEDKYPNKMHPIDLIAKAKNRAWIQFINSMTWDAFHLSAKETKQEYEIVLSELHRKLDEIESSIVGGEYYNGDKISLLDATIAPLFQRLNYINEIKPGVFDIKRHRKIVKLNNSLMKTDTIKLSCVPDIKELYYSLLGRRKGYISGYLQPKFQVENESKSNY